MDQCPVQGGSKALLDTTETVFRSNMLSYVQVFALLILGVNAKVNGWTSWSKWSPCTKTCGCGSKYRTRECNSNPKAVGGPGCNGSTFDIRSCHNTQVPCPMWGPWSPFSPCTCTCGGGIKAQSRVCNRIPKAGGGPGCVGNSTRILPCNTYPCTDCSKAPAITQKLPDSSFSAYSTYSSSYFPKYARFTSSAGWCSLSSTVHNAEYLQIDFKGMYMVCGVATRGHATAGNHWTTKYRLALSLDGKSWQTYKENGVAKEFPGNKDNRSIVMNVLKAARQACYVRFIPTATAGWPCFRVEVYGFLLS